MYCPKCGTKCEDTFRFCYRCGFTLPIIHEDQESTAAEEPIYVADQVTAEPIPSVEPVINEPVTVIEPVAEPTAVSEPVAEPTAVSEPVQQAPAKKGRLWPPLLILLVMMAVGLWVYLANPTIEKAPTPVANETPWFSVKNGVLEFDESLYDGSSELVVPSTVDGQTVTAIGKGCFKECRSLTTVILPDTLMEIREQAFSDCTNIRGIFIPEGVTKIASNAFSNCLALEAIHLPESLEELHVRALSRCRKLKHIFFAGTYENWTDLYAGTLPEGAWIYCEDGDYPYISE